MSAQQPVAGKPIWWRGQIAQFAMILAVLFVAKGAIAEPFYVPSASMEPTLLIGDALLASKFPYGYGAASLPIHLNLPTSGRVLAATPKRGDVVVFRWPGDESQVWVKRVIGLPGDRVAMRGGRVILNGAPLDVVADGAGTAEDDDGGHEVAQRFVETLPGGASHPIFKMRRGGRLDDQPEVTVPPGKLFVMGDNRDNSADSRVAVSEGGVGLLPEDNLVGRVDVVLGSWDMTLRHRPIAQWPSGVRLSRFFTTVQ